MASIMPSWFAYGHQRVRLDQVRCYEAKKGVVGGVGGVLVTFVDKTTLSLISEDDGGTDQIMAALDSAFGLDVPAESKKGKAQP